MTYVSELPKFLICLINHSSIFKELKVVTAVTAFVVSMFNILDFHHVKFMNLLFFRLLMGACFVAKFMLTPRKYLITHEIKFKHDFFLANFLVN